jgi:hypothetical protein
MGLAVRIRTHDIVGRHSKIDASRVVGNFYFWDYFRVVRDAPETAMTAWIGGYIVRTARNRALPSATRS